jgi:hypothetical protein
MRMMSAPVRDWIAAVMRVWRSLRVDGLERDLHLHLLTVVGDLAPELHVGLGDEGDAVQEVKPRRLSVGRSPPDGEDIRQATGRRGDGDGPANLQDGSTIGR